MVGKSLGPYKIVEQLGKGGMGEVWLAEDTRLGRKVAVKVLPGELAGDADRRSRFEQESKAAAALNHPHIAAIHDVGVETLEGDTHPTHFMVQEYLQGETLREAIARGLAFGKAVTLCVEIGEALKAAHRAGIVHRDLKPDNVFVTQDGHAKVLDFGLAKLTEIALPSGTSASVSPTMTMAGQIMGTAGYMAPEQVRGEEVDERADLFALGCVLYEAVSGKQAFGGSNVHESLSNVLSAEPALLTGTQTGNPTLAWILAKLLHKDREQRYQSAGDLVVDLRRMAQGDASFDSMIAQAAATTATDAPEPVRRSPLLLGAVGLAALLLGALGAWVLKPTPPTPAKRNLRFDLMLHSGDDFTSSYNRVATIAPDARAIAYTAKWGVLVRYLDRSEPELVPTSLGGRSPAFSASSEQIAFWSDGHIKRFRLGGSTSLVVTPLRERPMGMHWSDDGFLYIGRADQGIWRVPADGGQLEQVLALPSGELAHGPELLPGGEWIVFTLARGVRSWDAASIVAHNLVTTERRVLVDHGREVRVSPSGHLLYVQNSMLFAAPFDPAAVALIGPVVAVGERVQTSNYEETGAAGYDISDDGVLAFAPPFGFGGRDMGLVWVDRNGDEQALPIEQRRFSIIDLSPDEKFVAAEVHSIEGTHVWIYRVDRSSGQRLTTTGRNTAPVWSHDGQYVYFASDRDGDIDIWRRRADLSLPAEQMLDADGAQVPSDASHDGAWLAYQKMVPSNTDIERLSLSGDGVTEALVDGPADELVASFSRGGRFICYQSDASGRWDIMVHEIATGRRWIVSDSVAYNPWWSRDGKSILFLGDGEFVFRASVETSPEFSAGEVEVAFPTKSGQHSINFVASGDGQRLLIGSVGEGSEAGVETRQRVTVIMDWVGQLGS